MRVFKFFFLILFFWPHLSRAVNANQALIYRANEVALGLAFEQGLNDQNLNWYQVGFVDDHAQITLQPDEGPQIVYHWQWQFDRVCLITPNSNPSTCRSEGQLPRIENFSERLFEYQRMLEGVVYTQSKASYPDLLLGLARQLSGNENLVEVDDQMETEVIEAVFEEEDRDPSAFDDEAILEQIERGLVSGLQLARERFFVLIRDYFTNRLTGYRIWRSNSNPDTFAEAAVCGWSANSDHKELMGGCHEGANDWFRFHCHYVDVQEPQPGLMCGEFSRSQ